MTEAEWLACADPDPMLRNLAYVAAGRTPRWYDWLTPWRRPKLDWDTGRKPRLFTCACARRVWHLLPQSDCAAVVVLAERPLFRQVHQTLPSPECCRAIMQAEGFAEGRVNKAELEKVAKAARDVAHELSKPAWEGLDEEGLWDYLSFLVADGLPQAAAAWAATMAAQDPDFAVVVAHAAMRAAEVATGGTGERSGQAGLEESVAQCDLIRDVFGNPFRPAVLDSACRTPAVLELGGSAYEERSEPVGTLDAARLTILADAFEEAGCTDADILSHLRGPGPHVRGCWALDLILGRE